MFNIFKAYSLPQKGERLFRKGSPRIDLYFMILAVILGVFGSIMIFSAGSAYAEFRYDDKFFFAKRQILWLVIGIFAMLGASRVKAETYIFLTPVLYTLTLFLLVLVLIVGLSGNGAQRWISIGPLTLQPSEIAKMTVVMMLAYYFHLYGDKHSADKDGKSIFIYSTLIPCAIMAVPILLIMLQKHLSCIIILGLLGLSVIVASGTNTKYIRFFVILGIVSVICIALFTDYTKERITVWQNPEEYKLTGGWQTLQGLMAIGSGGIFGLGLGNSLLKYCYVSEPANDMIFAILCEELGFIGALVTLAIFALLIVKGYSLSFSVEDTYKRLVIFGIVTKIAIQTLLNVAVVTNTIPNTGISLPFFSYGGSSLIMIFFEIGIILSFSRTARIIK